MKRRLGRERPDAALETSDNGIVALKISLAGLGFTAVFQVVIAASFGSMALLADTSTTSQMRARRLYFERYYGPDQLRFGAVAGYESGQRQ